MSAARSPTTTRDTNDPFRLDRLAEELAAREQFSTDRARSSSSPPLPTHELPLYVPLSHSNPHLTAPTFSVEQFLLSRSHHVALPDLRSELRDYLATLKEELVKLINDDYEAFISLSTDLRGEGARLERLKYPLGTLKSEILSSKSELQVIQDAIQDKLKKRAILREEKAILHLLLKISDLVTRLESLLLIAAPPGQDIPSPSPEISSIKLPSHLASPTEADDVDDRARGNRAKHLARVAAEYTQLLYHVSKARASSCVYIDEIQWRIDRIQSTLSSDLDHLFASTLLALTSTSPSKLTIPKGKGNLTTTTSESEKARLKLTADLTECLRTYDVLGLWRDAEDVLRRELVRGFVKKTIYPGALTAPHSPLVPHTPFPPTSHSQTQPIPSSNLSLTPNPFPTNPPLTPYTPFTAFASKQSPFELAQSNITSLRSGGGGQSCFLLDENEDTGLARVYNQVLRFVERDLGMIMEVGERVCLRSSGKVAAAGGKELRVLAVGKDKKVGETEKEKVDGEGFEIMANVVWAEFGRAIIDELGNIVFAAGRPDEFRKHHEMTQAFIRSLEFLAPSIHAIEAMRAHPTYVAFERRWQLLIYFQLRWKEIVGKLEEALSVTMVDPSAGTDKEPFVTSQAAATWVAISTCWSAEVYIPQLDYRFWKLTLQLLSRYKTWLDVSLPAFEPAPKVAAAIAADKNVAAASQTRTSTPALPAEGASAESNAADDALLLQFAAALVDIKTMQSQMLSFFKDTINMMLPDSSGLEGSGHPSAEDALRHQLSILGSLVLPMSNQIINILTRRSCDALLPVRSILSQFRAMSNKRMPTEASYFVPSILRPLRNFFGIGANDRLGERLKDDDFMKSCVTEVFESVCHRYIYYLTAMKKTEESLRRLKKGQKTTFSLFGGSNTVKDNTDRRDEERTRTQMILDVNAFSKDAGSLGINVLTSDVFQSLNAMVHTDLIDAP